MICHAHLIIITHLWVIDLLAGYNMALLVNCEVDRTNSNIYATSSKPARASSLLLSHFHNLFVHTKMLEQVFPFFSF
jgi:hypothetical protein